MYKLNKKYSGYIPNIRDISKKVLKNELPHGGDVENIAKQIGLLLSVFGTFLFSAKYIYRSVEGGPVFLFDFNFLVVICTISIFVSNFFKFGKYVQVFSLSLTTLVTIFLEPDNGVSYSLLVFIVILMYKYELFNKNPITKFSIYTSLILLTSVTGSIRIRQVEDIKWPIEAIVFFAFYLTSFMLIFYDEMKIYKQNEKKFKSKINNLNTTIKQTQGYIEKIEANYIDPMQAGLTEKELMLLEALCITRESNTELGKRLGKSPNTVKVQLSKIMNKISVETRYDLINHCRYHFIKQSEYGDYTIKI